MTRTRSSRSSSLLCLIFFSFLLTSTDATTTATSNSYSSIISRFQTYLQINTAQPTPDYAAAIDFLLAEAKSLNLQTHLHEFVPGKPLLLVEWPGRNPSLPTVLFNSHTDVVPVEAHKWSSPPFSAHLDPATGNIYARGSQDMKCVGTQYLEAVRRLVAEGFVPERTVWFSYVPDEEVGGEDGLGSLVGSKVFEEMDVAVVLDEGLASESDRYRVFYGERSPWWTVIKAVGAPGHGSKLYDNSATENLMKSVEMIRKFRTEQFDMVKSGEKAEGEVISVNMVYLKSGTPSKTGFIMNLQPSEAEAGFDIRVPPNADIGGLEKLIAEVWAPSYRNMSFEFKHKVSVHDKFGKPAISVADGTNPWWALFEEAVRKANGKLGRPEIFPASTDAQHIRKLGLPAFGFSPMSNTPILLHDHNEFLNQDVYLRGIEIYESIIKAFASFTEETKKKLKDEL